MMVMANAFVYIWFWRIPVQRNVSGMYLKQNDDEVDGHDDDDGDDDEDDDD